MEEVDQNNIQFEFHKENDKNKFWKVRRIGKIYWGEHLFSIDKKKIYNLFADYPNNFTREEKVVNVERILYGSSDWINKL